MPLRRIRLQSIPFPELLATFKADPHSLIGKIPGIFLINKEQDWTSHDVVAKMRGYLKMKRVGHGGTLDPMAEGLLLIFAGNATKLFDAMQEYDKEYIAGFRLGLRTDTQDITGTVLEESDPALLPITEKVLREALKSFEGKILQLPPMYSAIKVKGKKLYELAREGKTVEREPREVETFNLELLEFDGVDGKIKVSVSKGFYIRTLIEDFGQKLGCFATMTSLTRTRIGTFSLDNAYKISELPERPVQE